MDNISGDPTWQDKAKHISQRYLDCLTEADLAGVLALFAADGTVSSPLYGEQAAAAFYPLLFGDTQVSRLKLIDVLSNADQRTVALFFHYEWQLADGEWVQFDVIDHLRFNERDQITSLHIIYDTQASRPALARQQAKKPRS